MPTRAQPSPLALDLVLNGPVPVAGEAVNLQVRRDGQPLAGQAVQLLHERLPVGLWVRTDAQGQASLRLPMAGDWMARGTDLRPPAAPGAPWDSRFFTLSFTVLERR